MADSRPLCQNGAHRKKSWCGPARADLYKFHRQCHPPPMDDAAALLEIESIKKLKARYCRYLDT
ncbi:MAG: hypothetical protein ACXWZL_10160, partial [Mycobacterium sp.]